MHPTSRQEYQVLLTAPCVQGLIAQDKTQLILLPQEPLNPESTSASGLDAENPQDPRLSFVSSVSRVDAFSSRSSTHASNADPFDADAFLSASLGIEEEDEDEDEEEEGLNEDGQLEHFMGGDDGGSSSNASLGSLTLTSPSGSITPKPSSSPVANGETWLKELTSGGISHGGEKKGGDASQIDQHHISYEVQVLLNRPISQEAIVKISDKARMKQRASKMIEEDGDEDEDEEDFKPDEETKVWLTMSGLARAGVFAGDWVSQTSSHFTSLHFVPFRFAWIDHLSRGVVANDFFTYQQVLVSTSTSGKEVLAKAELMYDWLEPAGSDPADHMIWISPQLLRCILGPRSSNASNSNPTKLNLQAIPSGRRTPALPIAKGITLARVLTPRTVTKQYDEAVHLGLQRYFETERPCKRLVHNGDIIGIPVKRMSEWRAKQDPGEDDEDETHGNQR